MYPYMSKPTKEKNISIPDHILKSLLTPSEIRMLKNRWQIVQYLEQGFSIRKIAKQVKVGTDTVLRIIRMVEKDHLIKISRNEKSEKLKSSTPWIFGKSHK